MSIAIWTQEVEPGKFFVGNIHYKPELLTAAEKSKAIMVEALPKEPAPVKGKGYNMFINPDTKEIYYEQYDVPKTDHDLLEEVSDKLSQLIDLMKPKV